jgi:hypothetical protein
VSKRSGRSIKKSKEAVVSERLQAAQIAYESGVAPGVALASTQIHAGYREAWSSVKFAT